MEIITMLKAKRIMNRINTSLTENLAANWNCYIKKTSYDTRLVIKYVSYKEWETDELITVLNIIRASKIKHNLTMYHKNHNNILEIEININ